MKTTAKERAEVIARLIRVGIDYAGYYKAKLLAIDEAASKCSAALALAEKGME